MSGTVVFHLYYENAPPLGSLTVVDGEPVADGIGERVASMVPVLVAGKMLGPADGDAWLRGISDRMQGYVVGTYMQADDMPEERAWTEEEAAKHPKYPAGAEVGGEKVGGRWKPTGGVGAAVEWNEELAQHYENEGWMEDVVPVLFQPNETDISLGVDTVLYLDSQIEEQKDAASMTLADELGTPEAIAALAESDEIAGQFISMGLDFATARAVKDGAEPLLGAVGHDWEDATPQQRAEWLSDRYVRYALTSGYVHQWAIAATDAHVLSLATQMAVAAEFGLPDEVRNNWGEGGFGGFGETARQDARDLLGRSEEAGALRALVRANYDATQKGLSKARIQRVLVTRGVVTRPPEVPTEAPIFGIKIMKGDKWKGRTRSNPISSWTIARSVARSFGDYLITTEVPASHVFSTAMYGLGCMSESEVILLGGDINATVERNNR